jgi:hypothetical protein
LTKNYTTNGKKDILLEIKHGKKKNMGSDEQNIKFTPYGDRSGRGGGGGGGRENGAGCEGRKREDDSLEKG